MELAGPRLSQCGRRGPGQLLPYLLAACALHLCSQQVSRVVKELMTPMTDSTSTNVLARYLLPKSALRTEKQSLMRRLSLMSGLAIIAVVGNHAAWWAFMALDWRAWWPRLFWPQLFGLNGYVYYLISAVRTLAVFSVPAFLFVTGFFLAYASRAGLKYRMIGSRVWKLLLPYFVWSLVSFGFNWLDSCAEGCTTLTVTQYAVALLTGTAVPAFYYIPLLIQLLLLAPLLTQAAERNWHVLLAVSFIVQLGYTLLLYFTYLIPEIDAVDPLDIILWRGAFYSRIFDFALGIVVGLKLLEIKDWLFVNRKLFPIVAIVLGTVAVVEEEWLFLSTGFHAHVTPILFLYAPAVILTFIAFDRIPVPMPWTIARFGANMYGIYLVHTLVLIIATKVTYRMAPSFFASFPLLFFLIITSAGVLGPHYLMRLTKHTRLRVIYPWLFG